MDIPERNKLAAISRWNKIHELEKFNILSDKDSLKIKSGICGLLAGDGSVQVRKEKDSCHYELSLFADDLEMLKVYLNFIKKIYRKTPTISQRDNMYVARITSKVIVQDLLSFAKFGIYKWDMPTSLFSINGAKEYWLKGFFSAEGYVNPKYIKIQSVNLKGLDSVSSLLEEIGIKNKTYRYKPKNPNHSMVGLLFIKPKESRIRFYEKVGFWHAKKNKKLRMSLGL